MVKEGKGKGAINQSHSCCVVERTKKHTSRRVNKGGGELDKAFLRDGERGTVAGTEHVCNHCGKSVLALLFPQACVVKKEQQKG